MCRGELQRLVNVHFLSKSDPGDEQVGIKVGERVRILGLADETHGVGPQ